MASTLVLAGGIIEESSSVFAQEIPKKAISNYKANKTEGEASSQNFLDSYFMPTGAKIPIIENVKIVNLQKPVLPPVTSIYDYSS